MLSVGEILKKDRERKGLTLKQVEKVIKVREKFLKAIESNDWSVFSSKIYISGILKNYSQYLGLEHTKILAFFRRDYESHEETSFRKSIASGYLKPETRQIVYMGFFLIFLVFSLFFGYQLKLYLSPPEVTITEPKATRFRAVERVRIAGIADRESAVTVAGEHVYQNKDGTFEYSYPLKKGRNHLVIEVTGANGKKTVVTKDFILD